MRVYSDPVCLSHNPQHEILSGKPVPYLESPTRISKIKDVLRRRGTFEIMDHADPDINALRFILSVHGRDYVQYLETAYDRWVEDGGDKVQFHFVVVRAVHIYSQQHSSVLGCRYSRDLPPPKIIDHSTRKPVGLEYYRTSRSGSDMLCLALLRLTLTETGNYCFDLSAPITKGSPCPLFLHQLFVPSIFMSTQTPTKLPLHQPVLPFLLPDT